CLPLLPFLTNRLWSAKALFEDVATMFDKRQFAAGDFQLLARRTLFQGFFRMEECRVRHRLFRGGWSETYSRELFVRGSAVGVLLYDPGRDLVGLLEQFRVGALDDPAGPWLLEVVAGMKIGRASCRERGGVVGGGGE